MAAPVLLEDLANTAQMVELHSCPSLSSPSVCRPVGEKKLKRKIGLWVCRHQFMANCGSGSQASRAPGLCSWSWAAMKAPEAERDWTVCTDPYGHADRESTI